MTGFNLDALPTVPQPGEIEEALARVTEHNVALIDLQFSDIAGGMKALTIPRTLVERTFKHGYRFDGAAMAGGTRQVELDLYLAPDPSTLAILPRRADEPQRAQLFCWVVRRDGHPFAGDPRSTLQMQLKRAAAAGYDYQVGIEMEFYLLARTIQADAQILPAVDGAGYFDVGEDMLSGTRDEIINTLQAMNIGVGGAHHETGPGQQELDLLHTGGIRLADQIISTRQVIRSVAQRRGLRATFMAKPFPDAPGSGMHLFQRLLSYPNGDDLLTDRTSGDGLSGLGRQMIGGQLTHSRGMSAILCTTVNSYKRLADGHRAPRHATWARVSQASLIRVPAATPGTQADLELRSPDAMTNPYLAMTVALGAAMDGIRNSDEPGMPLDENIVAYDDAELNRLGVTPLPTTLGEALDAMAADDVIRDALGSYIFEQLLTVKRAEWGDYRRHVSPWEHLRYGDL
jgi:glutamine synthetase